MTNGIKEDKDGNYLCPECNGSLTILEKVEWGAREL
jgi:hypothetical protein